LESVARAPWCLRAFDFPRSAAIRFAFVLGRLSVPDTSSARACPSLPWLRRGPHQLIERKPMVVDPTDSPEGANVKPSIAMLLLSTTLFGSAITSFTYSSVSAARRDAAHAHFLAKPMSAEAVIPWVANWWVRANIRLAPVASDFRTSPIRVAR
jgi:hypothetical protein